MEAGQILDDTYQLLRRVGEGAMGVVYEATHARLAGRYAIKLLTQQLAEPEGLPRFDREARITSLLQHPNVVQVIDHNTAADGTQYLVMEYLAGESLSQRLARQGRLPLDAVVDIVDQIAAGLSAAHAHGIVHRDLKPDNVFLVPVEGRQTELIKILDFGISKRQGSLEMSGLVCGTPQYMAPEQVEGRVLDIDAATDQFALAVIAHELLTGRNPFRGDSVAATFVRISSKVPTLVGFGRDVDAVLARALAKSGRERFRSVTDFSEALRAATRAWRQDLERKRRSRRRVSRMVVGAAATAIAIVVAAKFHSERGKAEQASPRRAESRPVPPAESRVMQPAVAPQGTVLTVSEPPPPRTDDNESTVARARQPARSRPRSHATTSRPRSVLSVDEDATMPPSVISEW
jgi:serine/threonine protein kinase